MNLELEKFQGEQHCAQVFENESSSTDTASTRDNSQEEHNVSRGATSFNDDLSLTIREGSCGLALYSVLGISACMAVVSLLIVWEYAALNIAASISDDVTDYKAVSAISSKSPWADLLRLQIRVIQNLIHASLLGSAAIVASYRGDAWCMFFSRNCAFYFGMPAISYVVVALSSDKLRGDMQQVILCSLFALFCSVAFIRFEFVSRTLLRMRILSTPSETGEDGNVGMFCVPRSGFEMKMAETVYRSAVIVQLISVLYAVVTTTVEGTSLAGRHRNLDDLQSNGGSQLLVLFESAYSLGAHEAFMLTLFLLCAVYPACPACYGGAILASAWRLLLALCSAIHLVLNYEAWHPRFILSMIFTSLEGATVVPILVSACMLAQKDRVGVSETGTTTRTSQASYSTVGTLDIDNDMDYENDFTSFSNQRLAGSTSCPLPDQDGARMECNSLSKISVSSRHSRRQRLGAKTLWKSSFVLFIGMTFECIMSLTTTALGSHEAHDIYKWGMHACAMYLFCCVMNVADPTVYSRARMLLVIACPTGAIIGMWQLWLLLSIPDRLDYMSCIVGALFGLRAICGFCQTIGLVILDNTQESVKEREDERFLGRDMIDGMGTTGLFRAVQDGRSVLLRIYVPSVALYTATVVTIGNNYEPMISPSTWCSAIEAPDDFAFAPHWPGIGLSFHFGLLLVVFASDGLTTEIPSYPPSLIIACVFSGQVTILLVSHLIFDVMQSHTDTQNGRALIWFLRTAVILWIASAAYLCFILNQIRRLKHYS